MSNDTNAILRQLSFENYIWIIFIIIGIFSIFGDELIKKSIIKNDAYYFSLAKTIFFIIIIVTLIVYIYFIRRNYRDYLKNINSTGYQIRLIGSLLIFIGTICFLYFLITEFNNDESLSNI